MIILTVAYHRRLVEEGIKIMDGVNGIIDSDPKPFHWIGFDPSATEVKSFWYKVQCRFCHDQFPMCLPKKNLESNLLGHLASAKHMHALKRRRSQGRGGQLWFITRNVGGLPGALEVTHFQTKGCCTLGSGWGLILMKEVSISWDKCTMHAYVCWRFRGPNYMYVGLLYNVLGLLNHVHFRTCFQTHCLSFRRTKWHGCVWYH